MQSLLKSNWSSLITPKQLPWWIEINTIYPCCTYFFGPFHNIKEAEHKQIGYIDDIVEEKAFGITVEIKQCNPTSLTIFDNSC